MDRHHLRQLLLDARVSRFEEHSFLTGVLSIAAAVVLAVVNGDLGGPAWALGALWLAVLGLCATSRAVRLYRSNVTAALPESVGRAGIRIRCLQRVVAGRRNGAREVLPFRVKRVAYEVPVRSGKNRSVSGSCARGRFSLGTGVSLDRGDDISLIRAFPSGSRGGSWFFRNSGAPEPVTSYLLCLSRSSRFG